MPLLFFLSLSLTYERVRSSVLRFLQYTVFSTVEILIETVDVQDQEYFWLCLLELEKQNEMKSRVLETVTGNLVLWGITRYGQIAIADSDVGTVYKTFGSRISLAQLPHRLGLQKLEIIAQRLGCQWEYPSFHFADTRERPDALLIFSHGYKVAIEYERSLKGRGVYPYILSDRLRAIRRGEYHSILWLCERNQHVKWLSNTLLTMNILPVMGVLILVDKERVHRRISIIHLNEWSSFLERKQHFDFNSEFALPQGKS